MTTSGVAVQLLTTFKLFSTGQLQPHVQCQRSMGHGNRAPFVALLVQILLLGLLKALGIHDHDDHFSMLRVEELLVDTVTNPGCEWYNDHAFWPTKQRLGRAQWVPAIKKQRFLGEASVSYPFSTKLLTLLCTLQRQRFY